MIASQRMEQWTCSNHFYLRTEVLEIVICKPVQVVDLALPKQMRHNKNYLVLLGDNDYLHTLAISPLNYVL